MAYEGPWVFRAPFGNDAAQENFERTVEEGIRGGEISRHTDAMAGEDRVRLWGTKGSVSGTWEDISPGDFLIFYNDGRYEYAAEVVETEHNEALGRAVWPNFDDDPWVCIIYLEEPVELDVASAELHDLAGYEIDYTMGFQSMNEMGVGAIRGKYGSIEEFVYGADRPSPDVDPTAEPDVDVPEDVLDGLYFPDGDGTSAEAIVEKVNDALNAGKHIIFTGPPGTGKTEIARRVSEHLSETHGGVFTGYEMTTATADWSTFETVGGYMPGERGDADLGFEPGQVLRCFKQDGQQRNDLLVIDEINRSDIDKSFGQLFTLLSGQGIELPYTRDGEEITVDPASDTDGGSPSPHEYRVPSSWRIFGTMNSYDKTSLYEMSYAFMRRFAFIYVDAPAVPADGDGQRDLVAEYADRWEIDADDELYESVGEIWYEMNTRVDERRIGPAIVEDILRHTAGSSSGRRMALTEAVLSYVYPQLEGVRRREQVVEGLANLDTLDGERLRAVAGDLLQVRSDG